MMKIGEAIYKTQQETGGQTETTHPTGEAKTDSNTVDAEIVD